jgi:ABC-type sugar transport system ATPase subunit
MFVSHRLDEVREIADEISVLRDGSIVERVDPGEATPERLAEAITGGVEVVPQRARSRAKVDRPSLRVEEAVVSAAAPPIDLELSEGEVFGLTGLLGSGAERLVRMVGGADPLRGKAYLHGRQINLQTPRDALRSGIGFIPEDRKAIGLIGEQSIAVNISLASLESVSRHGVLSHKEISARAIEYCDRLKIRTSSIYLPVSRLSGGNMQKVLLAKWLASGANVLAIEEPTHGIDIGGKAQVHELLREFADSGGTVLLASTDAEEVLELCDRIGLMRHGALSHVMSTGEVTRRFVTEFGAQSPEEVLEQYVDADYPDANGSAAVEEGF